MRAQHKPALFFRIFPVAVLLGLWLASHPAHSQETAAAATAQGIVHGLDYLAVDYPGVVAQGQVINAEEYAEQQEIATHTRDQLQGLPASEAKTNLLANMQELQQAIAAKADGDVVVGMSRNMVASIMANYEVDLAPVLAPDLVEAQQLFQAECGGCHGAEGYGNGPMAVGLEPAPANFHNRERQAQRSLLGLYNTISLGVEGTAMRAFTEFTPAQRWSLAFYVGGMAATAEEQAAGMQLWQSSAAKGPFTTLPSLTKVTGQEVRAQWGEEGEQLMAYLRANPALLVTAGNDPLAVSLDYLQGSIKEYRTANQSAAYQQAVAAYLEGFELVETRLNAIAPDLRTAIEKAMMVYRNMLKGQAPLSEAEQQYQHLIGLLDQAKQALSTDEATPAVSFFAAALILLREGLEAILVLAAIIALLVKADRRDALRYIHAGWLGALALGVLTWFVADRIIHVSGASREITEGVTALVAAGMLLYVGFWLHNQSHSKRWQQFIHSKISTTLGNDKLSAGTLWGLTFVAFMAVYREVFETILFYRSMWMSAKPIEQNFLVSGIVVAAVILVLLAWVVMKLSVRLPLKRFFKINTVLMFILAVIFAGKGVAALQEAGTFPIDPVNFPRVDMLGIYPSVETLGTQLLLLGGVGLWWLLAQIKSRRAAAQEINA